jgi:serine/threonine-protein kinase PknK
MSGLLPAGRPQTRPDGGTTVEVDLPGYHDLTRIGSGGQAVVYRAVQVRLDRPVALKILNGGADDAIRRQFRREGQAMVALGQHPHIVQVFDVDETDDGRPYLVMEYCEGGSAEDRLAASGSFSIDDTLTVGIAVADALAAAHAKGLLHRDVKPSNVLLSEFGPRLGDFGIARPAEMERTTMFSAMTAWHAAPEVLFDGAPTKSSDLWSLGSTLYTLLAGCPPFVATTAEGPLAFIDRLRNDEPPALARDDVPASLQALLLWCMKKTADERIETATDVRDHLTAIQRDLEGRAPERFKSQTPSATRTPPRQPSFPQVPIASPRDVGVTNPLGADGGVGLGGGTPDSAEGDSDRTVVRKRDPQPSTRRATGQKSKDTARPVGVAAEGPAPDGAVVSSSAGGRTLGPSHDPPTMKPEPSTRTRATPSDSRSRRRARIIAVVCLALLIAIVSGGALFRSMTSPANSAAQPAVSAAAPAESVTVGSILDGGKITDSQPAQRASLGVTLVSSSGGDGAYVAYVAEVVSGSGADKAGLQAGDLIVGIDGKSITSPDEIGAALDKHHPGGTVTLEVVRNGKTGQVEATLGTTG